jgi:hypothetical protein
VTGVDRQQMANRGSVDSTRAIEPNPVWTGRGEVVKKISWSQLRSRLEPPLELELRVCIELLWVMPAPGAPLPAALLASNVLHPSNVMVGVDGTVSLESTPPRRARESARYIAPELRPDASAPGPPKAMLASAIYAVGALLFEAVSRKSFASSEEVEREIRYGRARAAATGLAQDVAEIKLLEIAAKATCSTPELRWPTPEAFSRELDRVAGHRMATREGLARVVASLLAPEQTVSRPPPPVAVTIASRIKTLRGMAVDASRYSARSRAIAHHPDQAELAVANSIHPQAELHSSLGRRNQRLALAGLVATLLVALPLAFMGVFSWTAPAHIVAPKSAPTPNAQRAAPGDKAARARVAPPPEVLFSGPTEATAAPCATPTREADEGSLESKVTRDKPRPLAKPSPPRTEHRIPDYGI